MAEITNIDVKYINPHPDNPRKELGELSELAASIKANGILQNLTVVPYYSPVHHRVIKGLYTVIIGHRRLAAAKLAGVETVPCVIADMSPEEQIATMLTENMQRSDLTVYEQAKSFQQLSLDFGKTVQEISAMSGFSETTVRRRQKLAELDEKKLKTACERGATLFDLEKLEKLEDPEAVDRCLAAAGTQNFNNALRAALDQQTYARKRKKWIEQLDRFASKIENVGSVAGIYTPMSYVRNYGSWTKEENVTVPEDAETVRYFYAVSDLQISLYREQTKDAAKEAEERKRAEIREADEARWKRAQEISARHKELRREFVINFAAAKSNSRTIMRNCIDAMLFEGERNYYSNLDTEELCELLAIPYDSERNKPDREALQRLKAEQPERLMLLMTYWYMDKYGEYISHDWDREKQRYLVHYRDNPKLDALYYFLEELGYERSDEERQMSRGTHTVFDEEQKRC